MPIVTKSKKKVTKSQKRFGVQVNTSPPTPKDSELESKSRLQAPQQWAKDGDLAFSSLFTAAEKKPAPLIKSVGNNVYRVENESDDTESESSETKKNETFDPTTLQPGAPAPVVSGFGIGPATSTINFKLNTTILPLTRTGASVMIQVITHIRGISAAYNTVQFDIPDHQVGIRITSIGSSMKITLTTADDALRNDLKSNQSDLTQVLRRELSSPKLEFSVENPPKESSSGNGGKPKQNPDTVYKKDDEDME